MKALRLIALSAVLTLGAFSAVMYTSCSKDECKDVTCLNGGTCSGGNCSCKSGVGGNSCETIYRNGYANRYKGTASDNEGGTYTDHVLAFTTGTDTSDYTKMSMQWVSRTGAPVVTVPIVLSNNTSTGSVFTVTSTTTIDTLTYTGTGTINGSTVTLSLTEKDARGNAVIISFNNFLKQ